MNFVKRLASLLLPLIVFSFCTQCTRVNNEVNIKINWNNKTNEVKANHWGVNDYEFTVPQRIANKGLQEFSKQLNPTIVRFHHALMADSLINPQTNTWDKERIALSFSEAIKAFPNAEFMINPIANWPSGLSKHGVLSPNEEEKIILLYTQFVQLISELNLPIHSIEIFNEKETEYQHAGVLEAYWSLFNRISRAIKKTNPDIKVAGPALTWPKQIWVEGFLDACGNNIDYFTWHSYYSGNPETPTPTIVLNGANHIDSLAGYVNKALTEHNLQNKVKSCITEYNVQWTWTPFEVRHANNIGAVFQAGVVKRMAQRNLEAALVWHLKGHSYGLIDGDNKLRSTGQLFLWGRKYLCGSQVEVVSSDSDVDVMPIVNQNGKKAVLLINCGNEQKFVFKPSEILGENINYAAQINDLALEAQALNNFEKVLELKPYSLTIISSY